MNYLYNLAAYIESKIPGIVLVYDDFTEASPEECTLIRDTGGTSSDDLDREDHSVQCLSRFFNKLAGKAALDSVYDLLRKQFHITLPEVTLDGVTYPAVVAWRILARQTPTCIGVDENVKSLHSVNFVVTIK